MPNIFGTRRQGYGRRRSSGLKLRLLIAAGFVLFGLVSFYGNTQKNPVTGEPQRVGMSAGEEQKMGFAAAPRMAQEHGGAIQRGPDAARVKLTGSRLVEALHRYAEHNGATVPPEYRFDFHLLRDERTINAFALPGGQVFVTYALYQHLTDGQLAGVLGHEVGHVVERHGAERMAKQKLTQTLTGAAGVAGGGHESARAAAAIGQMVNMKYGRGDELESDKWGVRLTALAGYDPRSMIGVMDILEKSSGGQGPPEMMSTHPKPANRKKYIQDVLNSEFPNGLPDGLVP